MEILCACDEVDPTNYKFIRANVTYRDSCNRFFIGKTSAVRSGKINAENVSSMIVDPVLIPDEHIFPLYENGITIVSESDTEGRWLKIPNLVYYDPNGKTDKIPVTFLQEVKNLEEISKSPHPNIMKYYGCVVKDNRIVGICLEKCAETLYNRTWMRRQAVDKEAVMGSIRSAVQHLHSLGLCHNDVSLSNIMFREDDTVALIDFDSCRRNGEKMGHKRGAWDCCDVNATVSSFENDFYSMRKVNRYLETGQLPD
ncbi:Protein kinase [Gracilaria domingensis]|nr:Protein kinase [Gracilaria domingensis]